MENKKKNNNYFLRILFVLFIIYFGLSIASKMGYYNYETNENVIVTESQIKKFEADLKNGVSIDINSYIVPKKNYDNRLTKASMSVTKSIESIFGIVIKRIFKIVNVLIG